MKRKLRLTIELSSRTALFLIIVALVISATLVLQSETMTMVASYPSPLGVYKKLTSTGATNLASKGGANVIIGPAGGPDSNLTVNGSATITGTLTTNAFSISGKVPANSVLASDSAGNVSWQPASNLSVPSGTLCGAYDDNNSGPSGGTPCQGVNPHTACPSGYTRQWLYSAYSQTLYACVKN
jgi:hypothetical protein